MHQIDGELVDPESLQLQKAFYMGLGRPQQTEAVYDFIWHEFGVGRACPAVLGVVVALTTGDVVGEGSGHCCAFGAVAFYEVGHMVADHAAEPAALISLVGEVVAHIGWSGHAYREVVRVAAGIGCRIAHCAYRPFGKGRIRQLQDEPVGSLAAELQGFRPVSRHPRFQIAAVRPRKLLRGAKIRHCFASGEAAQHIHRLAQLTQGAGLAPDDSHGRVASSDAADRAVAEHVVEGGEAGCQYCPVSRAGVGDHRADFHPVRGRQHLRIDHERLLPEHMRVESPAVAEAVLLGSLCQLHHPPSGRVGLKNYAEIHLTGFVGSPDRSCWWQGRASGWTPLWLWCRNGCLRGRTCACRRRGILSTRRTSNTTQEPVSAH